MPVIVKRRNNQSADQLLTSFNKATSRSTKAMRGNQAFQRNASRLKRKIAALKREEYRVVRRKKQFYV